MTTDRRHHQTTCGTVDPDTWHEHIAPTLRAYLLDQLYRNPEVLLEAQGTPPQIRPDVALIEIVGERTDAHLLGSWTRINPPHIESQIYLQRVCGGCDESRERGYPSFMTHNHSDRCEVLSASTWTRVGPEQLPTTVALSSDGQACVALVRYRRCA